MSACASNSTKRVLELKAKVKAMKEMKSTLEYDRTSSSLQIKSLEGVESSLRSQVSDLQVVNKDLDEKLLMFKKEVIG